MNQKGTYKYLAYGLLFLRIGLGILFMFHGYPKLSGGVEKWQSIGGNMQHVGIAFAPAFWGFMAAVSEFFGGILLLLGLFFRPALVFLLIVMVVATAHHLSSGDNFGTFSHPLENAVVFFSLLFTGPGPYSLDANLKKTKI